VPFKNGHQRCGQLKHVSGGSYQGRILAICVVSDEELQNQDKRRIISMPRQGNQILVVNKYITYADLDTPDSLTLLTVAIQVYIHHIHTYL
jgi:hypothetical protein